MKRLASVSPNLELNDENWKMSFGLDDTILTPIGYVKMGEHQKEKLFAKGRSSQFGMVVDTLRDPDIIIEEADKFEDLNHERNTSYLFVKSFVKEDGNKYVHFENVTVAQQGLEVSISSHIIQEKSLISKISRENLLYKAEKLSPISSELHLAEQHNAVPDLLPTQGDNLPFAKVQQNSEATKENETFSVLVPTFWNDLQERLRFHPSCGKNPQPG